MPTAPRQAFEEHVAYEGALHVACTALAPPDTVAMAHINTLNASVLATVAALGERRGENFEEDTPLATDMARVEAKLDVLIELVNRLQCPDSSLPPLHQVRFNAHGFQGDGMALPAAGTAVRIHVHFDTCRGLPLELTGRVAGQPTGTPSWVALEGLSDAVRDGIERLVFRHHRRRIAETRQGGHAVPGDSD